MRRTFVLTVLGMAALIVGVFPMSARALDKVTIVIPRDSVFVLNYLGSKDAGVFAKHGIDLDVDPRPFAGFLASLPSKQTMATTYSGMDAIDKINEGLAWEVIGGGLTVVNDVFVRKDSPIKTIADLRGKIFGTFSTGAGSYKAARAAIIDGYGLDLEKDTKLQELAGPALYKLLENGSVDAMLNISSFTVEAMSEPDKFRLLFAPDEYWRKKTGYPIVWAAPLVAWKSWVDENPDRAQRFAAASNESFRWLENPANLDEAVKKYGALAGVTKPAQIATYKKLLEAKQMFLTTWDKKAVDAEWKFLEMAKAHGILTAVPPEDKYAILVTK